VRRGLVELGQGEVEDAIGEASLDGGDVDCARVSAASHEGWKTRARRTARGEGEGASEGTAEALRDPNRLVRGAVGQHHLALRGAVQLGGRRGAVGRGRAGRVDLDLVSGRDDAGDHERPILVPGEFDFDVLAPVRSWSTRWVDGARGADALIAGDLGLDEEGALLLLELDGGTMTGVRGVTEEGLVEEAPGMAHLGGEEASRVEEGHSVRVSLSGRLCESRGGRVGVRGREGTDELK
jgi:hypothetical protein